MQKLFLGMLLAAGVTTAQAQVTGNLGLTSDYRFRGISQTQNAAAVQGGVDYSHKSGFYAGNWNSSVSSQVYTNGAGAESDVYAGYKKELFKGVVVDVGSYNYFYPGAGTKFDTREVYAGLGYGPVAAKVSQSLGNYFGTANSKNSTYTQFDLAQPITKQLSLVGHAGRTRVNNSTNLSYSDYNVGVSYDMSGWIVSGKYYTNTNLTSAMKAANTVNGEKLHDKAFVVSVGKSF